MSQACTVSSPEIGDFIVIAISHQLRTAYKVTLRKLNAQLPLSAGFVTEYVPLIFNGAVVAPDGTEFGGNVNVTTAPAPGAFNGRAAVNRD